MTNDEQKRVEEIRERNIGRISQYFYQRDARDIFFLLDLVKRQEEIIDMYESDPMSRVIRFRHDNPPEPYKMEKEKEADEAMKRLGFKEATP